MQSIQHLSMNDLSPVIVNSRCINNINPKVIDYLFGDIKNNQDNMVPTEMPSTLLQLPSMNNLGSTVFDKNTEDSKGGNFTHCLYGNNAYTQFLGHYQGNNNPEANELFPPGIEIDQLNNQLGSMLADKKDSFNLNVNTSDLNERFPIESEMELKSPLFSTQNPNENYLFNNMSANHTYHKDLSKQNPIMMNSNLLNRPQNNNNMPQHAQFLQIDNKNPHTSKQLPKSGLFSPFHAGAPDHMSESNSFQQYFTDNIANQHDNKQLVSVLLNSRDLLQNSPEINQNKRENIQNMIMNNTRENDPMISNHLDDSDMHREKNEQNFRYRTWILPNQRDKNSVTSTNNNSQERVNSFCENNNSPIEMMTTTSNSGIMNNSQEIMKMNNQTHNLGSVKIYNLVGKSNKREINGNISYPINTNVVQLNQMNISNQNSREVYGTTPTATMITTPNQDAMGIRLSYPQISTKNIINDQLRDDTTRKGQTKDSLGSSQQTLNVTKPQTISKVSNEKALNANRQERQDMEHIQPIQSDQEEEDEEEVDEERYDEENSVSNKVSSQDVNMNEFARKVDFCKCRKSRCLKLYCECFLRGNFCNNQCICTECGNVAGNDEERSKAIDEAKNRNSEAFNLKFQLSKNEVTHKKGCHCKKTHCLKKYCECFNAGLKCRSNCKCEDCKNTQDNLKTFGCPPYPGECETTTNSNIQVVLNDDMTTYQNQLISNSFDKQGARERQISINSSSNSTIMQNRKRTRSDVLEQPNKGYVNDLVDSEPEIRKKKTSFSTKSQFGSNQTNYNSFDQNFIFTPVTKTSLIPSSTLNPIPNTLINGSLNKKLPL